MTEAEESDLVQVMADFIDQGLVENIVIMFKRDHALYRLTGDLLKDDRFMVRLGVSVLFEELAEIKPQDINLAVPAILPLLEDTRPEIRGDALSVLGIIASDDARKHIARLQDDPDPGVAEIAGDLFKSSGG
ncbi:HEAT repeat domain-containing protein [Thermodesulfobacteriota bacterium]